MPIEVKHRAARSGRAPGPRPEIICASSRAIPANTPPEKLARKLMAEKNCHRRVGELMFRSDADLRCFDRAYSETNKRKAMQAESNPNITVRQRNSKSATSLLIQSCRSLIVPTRTASLPITIGSVPAGAGHSL